MRTAYYAERGWDERGVPTDEILEALSLSDLEVPSGGQ
jgi:aldehyde:ferredoxin oxidoreductase